MDTSETARSGRVTAVAAIRLPVWLRPAIALLVFGIAAGSAAAAPLRVLFIGNSLTAANDLPALLEAIAKQNGERILTRMVAYPNYSLEDHWNRGDARRAIAEGGWS